MTAVDTLSGLIRDVPDYPEPGIVFKDITPLLADGDALRLAVSLLARPFREERIGLIAGIESRGFIFGAGLAQELGVGFVPVRKIGKLPRATIKREYQLEYGTDAVEIHADALSAGDRVLVVDDVIATGGTLAATCELLDQTGAEVVGAAVLVELAFLAGRARLNPEFRLHSILRYTS